MSDPTPAVTTTVTSPATPVVPGVNVPDAAKYLLAFVVAASVFALVIMGKTSAETYIAVVAAPILALVGIKSAINSGAAAHSAGVQSASTTTVTSTPPA